MKNSSTNWRFLQKRSILNQSRSNKAKCPTWNSVRLEDAKNICINVVFFAPKCYLSIVRISFIVSEFHNFQISSSQFHNFFTFICCSNIRSIILFLTYLSDFSTEVVGSVNTAFLPPSQTTFSKSDIIYSCTTAIWRLGLTHNQNILVMFISISLKFHFWSKAR